MTHRRQLITAACFLPFLWTTAAGFAQSNVIAGVDHLNRTAPEAWAMRWFGSAALPTSFGGGGALPSGALELGIEAGTIPNLSAEERTVGFNGTRIEDVNRSSLFARPRLRVGLPSELWFGISWVPPIDLKGVKANIPSIELGRDLWKSGRFRLAAALTASDGHVSGDITCPRSEARAGHDPIGNPFGCDAASNDRVSIRSYGADITAAFRLDEAARWEGFVGLQPHEFNAEFDVNARYQGFVDHTRLTYQGWDTSGVLGVSWRPIEQIGASAEIFYAPLRVERGQLAGSTFLRNDNLVNLRFLVSYRLR